MPANDDSALGEIAGGMKPVMPKEIWVGEDDDAGRMWCHSPDLMRTNEEFFGGARYILKSEYDSLAREIKYLRWYGNKDCTKQADEAMKNGDLDD